ncbi:hypothetical protein [Microbacterium karelineae]|uniref:hypothetical protein n=1 Tax=Microbacterium karelineae TaxID=2654283 RepID=UPI0012EAC5A5|nr:hypothetical protein [Microbacterium karelineae]
MKRIRLGSGLTVLVTAEKRGRGVRVVAVAESSAITEKCDREYRRELATFLKDVAVGDAPRDGFPLTGAERLMTGLKLSAEDGGLPPHGVIRSVGGDGSEWTVVWRAEHWSPVAVRVGESDGDSLVLPLA